MSSGVVRKIGENMDQETKAQELLHLLQRMYTFEESAKEMDMSRGEVENLISWIERGKKSQRKFAEDFGQGVSKPDDYGFPAGTNWGWELDQTSMDTSSSCPYCKETLHTLIKYLGDVPAEQRTLCPKCQDREYKDLLSKGFIDVTEAPETKAEPWREPREYREIT